MRLRVKKWSVFAAFAAAFACNVERPSAGPNFQKPHFTHALAASGACSGCHERDRPAAFQGEPHGGGQDCGTCHNQKDDNSGWLPRKEFSHTPTPESCLPCHVKNRPAPPHAASGDCAGCHAFPKWK